MCKLDINKPMDLIYWYDMLAQGTANTTTQGWKKPECLDILEEHIESLISELPAEQRQLFEI